MDESLNDFQMHFSADQSKLLGMNFTSDCSQRADLSKTVPHNGYFIETTNILSSQGSLSFEWSHICDRTLNPVKLMAGMVGVEKLKSVCTLSRLIVPEIYIQQKKELHFKLPLNWYLEY